MAAPKIHRPTFSTQPGRTRVATDARANTAHNGSGPLNADPLSLIVDRTPPDQEREGPKAKGR